METLLLAITAIAVIATLVVGAAAWRLSRESRERSAARVAALAAAASDDQYAGAVPPLKSATASEAIWHPQRSDTRRVSETRPAPHRLEPRVSPWSPSRTTPPLGDAFLGGSVARPASGAQRGLLIAAGILFVVAMTGVYFGIVNGRSAAGASAQSFQAAPLELVSLGHERQNARLAINGTVRNPSQGATVEKLTAVALLFDQQGGLITTSRADVDYTRLAPGDESPFVIQLEAPSNVARYRVSFRNSIGVVPHVDRRGQEPLARETP